MDAYCFDKTGFTMSWKVAHSSKYFSNVLFTNRTGLVDRPTARWLHSLHTVQ
jgi:hypothetical protein